MKEFLGHYVTAGFARHHHEILSCLERGERGRRINILSPRGSAKSTLMAVVYPLHRICYREFDEMMGFEPDRFILILSKSYQMAASRVQSIKQELEANEILRATFGNMVGEPWGEKRMLANNVMLMPIGRGGQVRGSLFRNFRPSLIISDDLDDPETVENPDVRLKDQRWFDTDLLRAGALDGSTNFINIDTVKHEEATANILKDRAGWETLFYQAIEHPADLWHPSAEPFWKTWEGLYTDMTKIDVERKKQSEAFFQDNKKEMLAGVKCLWEEVIDYKTVREEMCDVGYWAVLRELQNSTRDPSRAIFDMDNAVRFSVIDAGLQRTDGRLVPWKNLAGGSVFLDWAGGKDNQDNAFAAAVGIFWEPMPGRRENASTLSGCHAYVFATWMDRVKLSLQVEAVLDILERGQSELASRGVTDLRWRLSIEDFVSDYTGAIKEYTQHAFGEARERRGTDVPLEFLRRFTNKVERIAALEPAITHGWLCFDERLSGDYIKQMALFPTADFMDGPDATEGACQLRITEYETVRAEKRERYKRQDVRVRLN